MTVGKRILVTGGTGTLSRPVADRLAAQGHEVRAVSRHAPADGVPGSFTWMAVDLLGGEVPQQAIGGGQLAPDHTVGRITFERFLAEHAAATGHTNARPAPRTR
jgi:uncharacterized protein YbjT (DUF2867 family)